MKKISEDTAYEMYDEMLDECCRDDWGTLGNPASYNMRRDDPIMYRCGFVDYVDSISDEFEVEGY